MSGRSTGWCVGLVLPCNPIVNSLNVKTPEYVHRSIWCQGQQSIADGIELNNIHFVSMVR